MKHVYMIRVYLSIDYCGDGEETLPAVYENLEAAASNARGWLENVHNDLLSDTDYTEGDEVLASYEEHKNGHFSGELEFSYRTGALEGSLDSRRTVRDLVAWCETEEVPVYES